MATVEKIPILGNTVDNGIINDCIKKYKEIKYNQNASLQVIANDEITEFDFSLIGHFLLFKEECPDLTITLVLQKNYANDSNEVIWKLIQQMVHAYYSTGKDIFTVVDGDGEENKASVDKDKKNRVVLSKKFLPIIYLNEKNYNMVFQNRTTFSILKINAPNDLKEEDALYKACLKILSDEITTGNYLEILSQLAFYRSLMNAKMLRYYLQKNDKLQIGNVQNALLKRRYWKTLISVFDEIKEQPAIYSLLFYTFTCSRLIDIAITKDTINKAANNITQLWAFTKELVMGINELAKNIIEHTTSKKGIISGFINNNEEFELSVFDQGEQGIMQTFKNYLLSKLSNENNKGNDKIERMLKDDLDAIKNKSFEVKDFFTGCHINAQTNRAITHLGLLFFSKLIEKNNENARIGAPLKVISPNPDTGYADTYPNSVVKTELPLIGTYYKITLSLSDRKTQKPYSPVAIPLNKSSDFRNDFFDFRFVGEEKSSGDKSIHHIELSPMNLTDRISESELWNLFKNSLEQKSNVNILCVDFSNVRINSSQLIRFIAGFEFSYPEINLIVSNIKTKDLLDLVRMNDYSFDYASKRDDAKIYWNKSKATLIHSFVKVNERKFYFTDVLWGKTKEDFCSVNAITSCTHFNSISRMGECSTHIISNLEKKLPQPFFDKNGNLYHFNLLIKDVNSKPLFCHNAEVLLQNEIKSNKCSRNELFGEEALITDIKNMQAYKIPKSHFRLGSKIHITDFYYAKPFFQNSFFAYKFALLIAYDLIKIINESKPNISINDMHEVNEIVKCFTLIGYGAYSELLISYVKSFLEKYYGQSWLTIKINTNTVNDTEDCKLNKPVTVANPIYENIIIIVPIATTFSTSIKIRKMLIEVEDAKRKEKEIIKVLPQDIIKPYYNILAVVDEYFDKLPETHTFTDEVFYDYEWKDIDKKKQIIRTKIFDAPNDETVEQKYYLSQPTSWHKIDRCTNCFPDSECDNKHNCLKQSGSGILQKCEQFNDCKARHERPLFVTDNTSLTPELILGIPKAKVISELDVTRKLKLTETSVKKGHIERNKNHYRYYFNDDEIWNENKHDVSNWLKSGEFDSIDKSKQAVILAPCHFSNAGFVEMVNEVVFYNRAAIVHYDPNIENAQNYETFYGKNIGVDNNADETVNLYYVDDAITSGGTFFTVNSFIQRINSERKLKFDACFFFINRTGFYENENIKRVLGSGKLYSFANLHLPYIKTINSRCPLCDEFVKYKKLRENSYLTRIKLHFQKEENKMKETDIYAEFDGDDEGKTCRRIEAIHKMYDLFSKKLTNEYLANLNEKLSGSYFDWVDFLLENTNCPFRDDYLIKGNYCQEGNLLTETQIAVLKSLTQSPFYNYKIIRESAFRWTLELLEKKIEQMSDTISGKKEITENSLNELKLLIRRATLLNSNYIISYKLIHLLKALYVHGIQEISDKGSASDNLLRNFTIFFTAQVNELLYQDEARSKELNNRLHHFENMLKSEPADSNSQLFRQLVRMLLEENAANIRTFAELFEKEYEKYRKRNEDKEIKTVYDTLKKHNQYKALLENVNENKMTQFLKVRLGMRDVVKPLKQGASEKKQEDVPAIKDKFNNLAQFIDVQEGGCFAIVKYKTDNNPYFMLYNEGAGKEHIESYEADYLNQEKFLIKFLKDGEYGYSKSISIIEFHKYVDGHWQDLFANKTIDLQKEIPLPTNINRLLLLRIDDDKIGKKNGQAMIGFYFRANDEIMTDIRQVRFLLLLRGDMSKYLKKCVEQSGTFRDWVENRGNQRKFEKLYTDNDHYMRTYRIGDCDLDCLNLDDFNKVFYSYFTYTNMTVTYIYAQLAQYGYLEISDGYNIETPIRDVFDERFCEFLKFKHSRWASNGTILIINNINNSNLPKTFFHKQLLRVFVLQGLDNALNLKHYPNNKKKVKLFINKDCVEIRNDFPDMPDNNLQLNKNSFLKKKEKIKKLDCSNFSCMTLTAIEGYCKDYFDCDFYYDQKEFVIKIGLTKKM
jgi:hypothetical protein